MNPQHSTVSPVLGTARIVPGCELMRLIRATLSRGQGVRMTATGSSMLPFIRNREVVELERPCASLVPGDIVLAQDPTGRYLLHRVVRIVGAALFLAGDAQEKSEGPFDRKAIVGRVVRVFRGRRAIALDRGLWRLAGLIWVRCCPRRIALLWLVGRILAIGRRFLTPFTRLLHGDEALRRSRPAKKCG